MPRVQQSGHHLCILEQGEPESLLRRGQTRHVVHRRDDLPRVPLQGRNDGAGATSTTKPDPIVSWGKATIRRVAYVPLKFALGEAFQFD
jgi:hypothetical protein